MSTQAKKYTSSKQSRIFFSKYGETVFFLPFLETFSFEVETNIMEIGSSFGKKYKVKSNKLQKFTISFNIPSEDWTDARSNHKKFQKLIRFNLKDLTGANDRLKSGVLVRFANLIHDLSPSTSNSFKKGVVCKINGISYQPDLELGFYDNGGMMFAKNFKLSLDLQLEEMLDVNAKLSKKQIDFGLAEAGAASPPTPEQTKQRKKAAQKKSPGRMFGFKTPYGKK